MSDLSVHNFRTLLRRLVMICLSLLVSATACAQTQTAENIHEAGPRAIQDDFSDIRRVAAQDTHSGIAVPRYVSIKYSRVNARRGPSGEHPILWQYQRKYLPVIVVAEMDIWRKIRDMYGDESWVRRSQLTGERSVLTRVEAILYHKPDTESRRVAIVDPNVVLSLETCNMEGWCNVKAEGRDGWIRRLALWGADPL